MRKNPQAHRRVHKRTRVPRPKLHTSSLRRVGHLPTLSVHPLKENTIFLGRLNHQRRRPGLRCDLPRSSRSKKTSIIMGGCLAGEKRESASSQNPAEPIAPHLYQPVVVSMYNYPSEGSAACSIVFGERLNVLSDEGDWWRVSSTATGRECYIPSSYTAKVSHGWLFEGITREKAEQLLLLPHNHAGSFIVRASPTHSGAYSLSVRRNTNSSWDSVKHYRIHRLPNGWFYISPGTTFPSLAQLVEHYSEVETGLCCLLREPCFIQGYNNIPVIRGPPPAPVRKPPLNWNEVDSAMIFSQDERDPEKNPVSEGLREAISSYLLLTDEVTCHTCKGWET